MELVERLLEQINKARSRVYTAGQPTPLHQISLGGADVYVKREDLGPIKAYKWRGAFNATACLTPKQRAQGIVAASAGNHAQGIALAAAKLGCQATIFMPTPTPQVKRDAVKRHGGENVTIQITGDSFSRTQEAAIQFAHDQGQTFIPPYDSLEVMAGQGTLADEVVMSGEGPFEKVYIAIGGGGLASAVSAYLKSFWPDCEVIGVEGVDQASMKAAIDSGRPVPLDYVDLFCDGTAVTQVGQLNYEICSRTLDRIITVTNEEVSEAIKAHWDELRVVPEPSGAMSLAGFLKDQRDGNVHTGEKVLTILCGANMDFAQLAQISRQAGLAARSEHSFRFAIPERSGSLVELLESLPDEVSIYDLQYGRTDTALQHPVLRLAAPEENYESFQTWLMEKQPESIDVSDFPQARFRVIPFSPGLFQNPAFLEVEFPERAGALLGFMKEVRGLTSLCYFNYSYSGERVGRALLGLDFPTAADRDSGIAQLKTLAGSQIRAIRSVPLEAVGL